MTTITAMQNRLSIGLRAKMCRVSRLLTQEELSVLAGVSIEDVRLLEDDIHLKTAAQGRLLKELAIEEILG